ncbi:MAG TPA: cohesin domain-containing protein [Candidatus Methylomirabilis sp.]|nr:cohesin domain-containing protein [Candidatus Methylomirabilis sp.]
MFSNKRRKIFLSARQLVGEVGCAATLALLSFSFCFAAHAASLYFSPSSGSYAVGKNFSVSVYVSSADRAMNAASGVISFSQDKLEVVSLSKSNSIFNLWVRDPAYSNDLGSINFEGVVLNPGFTGNNGRILTMTFKAKEAGTATLSFSSGLVLANDGKGTDILSGLGKASFTLKVVAAPPAPAPTPTPPPAPQPTGVTPLAPIVISPTHPDIIPWYASNDAKFTWQISNDTDEIRLFYDQSPTTRPLTIYRPPLTSKEVANLADGVWYLHLQLHNQAGWGDIAHFRFQIDTKPPAPFVVTFANGNETSDPRPQLLLNAVDTLSGIKYYLIRVDDNQPLTVLPETTKNNLYALPLQTPGKHSIVVQAFDRAENFTSASGNFTVTSMLAPIFTEYPSQLSETETLTVKGSTYPNVSVIVWLQREKDLSASYTVTSDKNGDFVFIADRKLINGIYKLWAQAKDKQGAISPSSQELIILVQAPVRQISNWTVNLLSVFFPFLALIILLAILLWYSRRHKSFKHLKSDLQQQINILEATRLYRALTPEEEAILAQLKADLVEHK